ncbi:MAG: L,D-transpeptidase family protein [Solirubrobacterales bacterium]|nr:L,D-transpeptidase family protein [Solirubrobacterales bacterium]
MGRLSRAFLLAGLVALIWCGAAAASIAPEPGQPSPTDPRFVPAPAPAISVPDTVGAGTDRGIHLSRLPGARVPRPGRRTGTYTARVLIRTAVRRRPAGRRVKWVARAFTRWSGGTQWLMVLGSRRRKGRQWLKVRLPIRPNGSKGWIPRDRVTLRHSPRYIVIDRSRRRLTVFGLRGRRRASFKVVVGKRSTPTPLGLFATYDRVRQADPNGFIGPWAVPLTAHSDKLRRFDGGPGLVALHGRDGASLYDPLGSARSHGCVRMNNKRIRQIVRVSLGTAVRIHR